MLQATFRVTVSELSAELLEQIKTMFKGKGNEFEVVISVKPKGLNQNIASRFEELYRQWKSETAPLSSGTSLIYHPAYQQIIGMGEEAIPFILIKLQEDPHHLFYALHKISGENPVPKDHAGDLTKMTADWLVWGRKQGYLS
jgi:hypothetical protein